MMNLSKAVCFSGNDAKKETFILKVFAYWKHCFQSYKKAAISTFI